MRRIIIAGGGTGGHLYPGIAVAREFQKKNKDVEILFVGTKNGLEAKVLPKEGFKLEMIRAAGFVGKGLFRRLASMALIPLGLIDSFRILARFRPQCVIGVGGYASGPLVISAVVLRIPSLILEENVVPGLTNRLLSYFADKVAIAFDDSRKFFRKGADTAVIGTPIREDIYKKNTTRKEDKFTLLIFGGSLGAHTINIKMVEAIEHLKEVKGDMRIIHQTGDTDYSLVKNAYSRAGLDAVVSPYIYDMASVYAGADLIISRAGATTVAELSACGKAAILIPFPFATYNHQEMNARAVERAGAAEVILNNDLTGEIIANRIIYYLKNRVKIKEMEDKSRILGRVDAASKMVDLCEELASNV